MSIQTLNDILLAVCKSRRDRVMLQKGALGWVPISSTEIYRGVVGVARALESWGVRKGDRVAILSENRPEWTIADFAALALGAVTVPIYSTQTPEQTSFILNDSGARIIALSTKHQLEKVLSIQSHTPVERILVMDAVETAHAVHMQGLMLQGPIDFDPEFDARSRSIGPDDLATIIYTSGTTGTPKGAMLSHGNMASNVSCSMEAFGFGTKEEVSVSFLPLSHVTARHVDSRCCTAVWCWRIVLTLRIWRRLWRKCDPTFLLVCREYTRRFASRLSPKLRAFRKAPSIAGRFRWGALTAPKLWPEPGLRRSPGKSRTGWFFPECARGWVERRRSSSPEARRWAAN